MKITVNRKLLNEAISKLLVATSKKGQIPALEGILFVTADNLTLTAFDLEIGIKTSIDCNVSEKGQVIFNAKMLSEMVKKFTSDNIEITTDDNLKATLKGDKTKYSLIGIAAEEFPELPEIIGNTSIEIEANKFKSMIRQTIFSVAVVDYRPIYTGSKIIMKDNVLTVVSLDNNRLALRREIIKFDGDFEFVVPGKTLTEIMKMLPEDDTKIMLLSSDKNILFKIGNYTITSRLLSGEFIDFNTILPKTKELIITVNARTLLESLDRVSILANDKVKTPIKFEVEENIINLSCNTSIATAHDELSCQTEGIDIVMGFNSRYLQEAVKGAECDEVVINISAETRPITIEPKEGDSFLYLIGPMRIKG